MYVWDTYTFAGALPGAGPVGVIRNYAAASLAWGSGSARPGPPSTAQRPLYLGWLQCTMRYPPCDVPWALVALSLALYPSGYLSVYVSWAGSLLCHLSYLPLSVSSLTYQPAYIWSINGPQNQNGIGSRPLSEDASKGKRRLSCPSTARKAASITALISVTRIRDTRGVCAVRTFIGHAH